MGYLESGKDYYNYEGEATQPAAEEGTRENNLNEEERQKLVLEHMNQVKIVANMILGKAPNRSLKEDIIQEGYRGLVKASIYFDPSKNLEFQTYAGWKIKGAILDFLRKNDTVSKETRSLVTRLCKIENEIGENFNIKDEQSLAAMLGLDLRNKVHRKIWDSVLQAYLSKRRLGQEAHFNEISTDEKNPLELAQDKENASIVRLALAGSGLSAREKFIIQEVYFNGLNQREVGEKMGLSDAEVSRLKAEALKKLNRYMARHKIN